MRSYCLHCRCAHGAHEEHEDAFTVAAGTPHVGGLWDCPLVYSTSIAPSQRVTAQASKSRVSEYCTASVCAQRASSTFTLWLLRTWHLLCKEFDAWHCTHTIKWSTTKGRMTYQLVQALESEVPEHQEQHQHHSTHR